MRLYFPIFLCFLLLTVLLPSKSVSAGTKIVSERVLELSAPISNANNVVFTFGSEPLVYYEVLVYSDTLSSFSHSFNLFTSSGALLDASTGSLAEGVSRGITVPERPNLQLRAYSSSGSYNYNLHFLLKYSVLVDAPSQLDIDGVRTSVDSTNNTMNTIIAPQLTRVENSLIDGSGNTVLALAQSAKTSANAAKTSADTAVSEIAKLKADSNLQFKSLSGYQGATVTTSTSFKYVIGHKGANEYQVKLDSGSFSAWTPLTTHDASGYLTLTGLSAGAHTLTVQVRQNTGSYQTTPIQMSFTFFKL